MKITIDLARLCSITLSAFCDKKKHIFTKTKQQSKMVDGDDDGEEEAGDFE